MSGRVLRIVLPLLGVLILIFAPATVTAELTEERIAESGLTFVARLTDRPIDSRRLSVGTTRGPGHRLRVWCAPLREETAWLCLRLNAPRDDATAAWVSPSAAGPIREYLYVDTDPGTVPNR